MTLLVRAIVRATDVDRVLVEDLVAIRGDRLTALVSRRERAPVATEQELRSHDAITRMVHDATPSLPSRFGEVFADEASLATALRARETTLAAELDRVGERVELAATLRWRASIPPREAGEPSSSGRAYLEARAAREHERQEAEQLVVRLVEQLPCERAFIRHRTCPRDGIAAIVTILSTRDEVPRLREHIRSFGERTRQIVTDVHGPVPPFSFVS